MPKDSKKEKYSAEELIGEHYKSLLVSMCGPLSQVVNDFNKKSKDGEITADHLIKYMGIKKYSSLPLYNGNNNNNNNGKKSGKHTACMWEMTSGPRKGQYCTNARAKGETMCAKHVASSNNKMGAFFSIALAIDRRCR